MISHGCCKKLHLHTIHFLHEQTDDVFPYLKRISYIYPGEIMSCGTLMQDLWLMCDCMNCSGMRTSRISTLTSTSCIRLYRDTQEIAPASVEAVSSPGQQGERKHHITMCFAKHDACICYKLPKPVTLEKIKIFDWPEASIFRCWWEISNLHLAHFIPYHKNVKV